MKYVAVLLVLYVHVVFCLLTSCYFSWRCGQRIVCSDGEQLRDVFQEVGAGGAEKGRRQQEVAAQWRRAVTDGVQTLLRGENVVVLCTHGQNRYVNIQKLMSWVYFFTDLLVVVWYCSRIRSAMTAIAVLLCALYTIKTRGQQNGNDCMKALDFLPELTNVTGGQGDKVALLLLEVVRALRLVTAVLRGPGCATTVRVEQLLPTGDAAGETLPERTTLDAFHDGTGRAELLYVLTEATVALVTEQASFTTPLFKSTRSGDRRCNTREGSFKVDQSVLCHLLGKQERKQERENERSDGAKKKRKQERENERSDGAKKKKKNQRSK